MLCECGCKQITKVYRNKYRRFIKGHNRAGLWWFDGKPHTTLGKKRPDAKQRMFNNNPMAKPINEYSRCGIHDWIRHRKPKPQYCEKCNGKPALDLHNISGKYTPSLNDWIYLCRKCHMVVDNRIYNLKQYRSW